jgi:AraC-like DNA-binding protein
MLTNTPSYTSEEVFSSPSNIPRYSAEHVLHPTGIEVNTFEELYEQEVASAIYSYHRVPFYHIFRYKGNGNFHYVENKRITLNNNCLLIINRNVRHKYSKHKCKGDMVLFTSDFFGGSSDKIDFLNTCSLFQSSYLVVPLQSEALIAEVDSYFSLLQKMKPESREQTREIMVECSFLQNLLITIVRAYSLYIPAIIVPPSTPNYMQQFNALLAEHYQTQKQVRFYADKLKLSERRLTSIVYATQGISAKAYINEWLLMEAIRLLKNTTLNQGEVANKLGFNFTYFVKFFRKHTGTTPAKYRQNTVQQYLTTKPL